jgi:hypothetical protein
MRLFTTLFEGKPTYLYNDLLGRAGARDQREGLRLRLVTDEPDLAALPWEFLYDVYRENFVALSGNTSVVRQRRTETPFDPMPPLKPPLRLLIVHGESKNRDEVEALHRLEDEAEALEMKIAHR